MKKIMISVLTIIMFIGSMCCANGEMTDKNPIGRTYGKELQRVAGDYDVDHGGGGTYHGGGLAPDKKCRTDCDSSYHLCSGDCMRGDIRLMGGCLGRCKLEYCKTVCE
jgi:hypothetical protein